MNSALLSLMDKLRNVPLVRLLGLTFAVLMLLSILISGFIARHYVSRWFDAAVKDAAVNSMDQVRRETDSLLMMADEIVQRTALAVAATRIDIDEPDTVSRYLRDAARTADAAHLSGIRYASERGQLMSIDVVSMNRQFSGPTLLHLDPSVDLTGYHYALSDAGGLGTRGLSMEASDPRNQAWYRQAVAATGRPVWSQDHDTLERPPRTITRSMAVYSDTGALLGVSAVDLVLHHLQRFLEDRADATKADIAIFLADGDWLTGLPDSSPLASDSPSSSDTPTFTALLSNTDDRLGALQHALSTVRLRASGSAENPEPDSPSTYSQVGDRRGHLLASPIGADQGVKWQLVMFIPQSAYVGILGREITPLLLLIALVAIGGVALMLGLLSLVVNPLRRLTDDARQIADGKLDVELQSNHGNEVGVLTDAMRYMQKRLQTTIEYLRQSNTLLKHEYRRIQATLDSLDDGVITFTDEGDVQFMNKAAEEKTGWHIREQRGNPLPDACPEDPYRFEPQQLRMQEAVRQTLRDHQGLEAANEPVSSLHSEDWQRPISCRLTILDDQRHPAQGVMLVFNELSDLLQLKQEHERTLAVHRQLSYVVEETANEIYVIDPKTLRITMMNRTARTNLGYSREEAERLTLPDIIVDFAGSFPLHLLDSAPQDRQSNVLLETTLVRNDGSRYPAETRLHYLADEDGPCHALIAQDITERRLHMQDLLLRDRAMASLEVGVFIIDAPGQSVRYVNRAMTNITGRDATELIGRAPGVFLGPEGTRRLGAAIRLAPDALPVQHFELQCHRRDGTLYNAALSLSHIHDASGKVIQAIGIFDDVTERVAAEASFRQSQKFDAIGRLSGGVAHDFNNLLNIISGRLEFLALSDLTPADRAHVQEAERAADMGARLTRRLLTFARQGKLVMTSVNLNELIRDTLSILQTSLTEQVAIRLDLESDPWLAWTDRSQIENAIVNLAINARDATPAGGQVLLMTYNICVTSPQNGGLALSAGDYVCLCVSDNGHGMDEETLSRVFEPFFTTKGSSKGTGLGLASIFGFVRQCGGDIVAESSIGRGTTISLYIPRYRQDSKQADAIDTVTPATSELATASLPASTPALPMTPQISSRTGNAGIRLLVVEDNPNVMEVTRNRLETLGYRLRCVLDAHEALDIIESDVRFDLLFCDIVLGGSISGHDIARAMQTRQPDCRILLTSGFSESMLGKSTHPWPVLQKPYRASQLESAIAALLDELDTHPA